MKIVQGDEIPFERGLEYRGGTFHACRLMEGEAGTPGNFSLVIGRNSGDFYSPRHRHNFEQVRYQIEGALNFGRTGKMTPGMIGYFPEGLHYGPQTQRPEDTTLTAKTVVYIKGTGTWDDAYATISNAFKKLKVYTDKEGLKPDGLPMTIFTSTDDSGFQYQAAVPIIDAPKNPPRGEIALGKSPEGHALKFVHHGSYDELDNTYEAITNYLDDKRLEAKDMFIEEYVTSPVSADPGKLTIDVYVLLK